MYPGRGELCLRPQIPIQHSIVDRLVQVMRLHAVGVVQVGDRPGHTEDLVVCPCGEPHLGHGPLQEIAAFVVQDAELAGLPMRHIGVVARRRFAEPRGLPLPRRGHHGPHLAARRAGRSATRKFAEGHRRDFNVNVDAIKQRPAFVLPIMIGCERVSG